jgi:alkaline phosphatase D
MDSLSQPIFELTASGMTHTWRNMMDESNRYRVGELVVSKNYGLIQIDWTSNIPSVSVQVLNPENQPLLTEKIY